MGIWAIITLNSENKRVHTAWNEEAQEGYFSIVDVIQVLTNNERPRKYWNDLKSKLKAEGSELSEKIGQLKMPAEDGKLRLTDVADIIESKDEDTDKDKK